MFSITVITDCTSSAVHNLSTVCTCSNIRVIVHFQRTHQLQSHMPSGTTHDTSGSLQMQNTDIKSTQALLRCCRQVEMYICGKGVTFL